MPLGLSGREESGLPYEAIRQLCPTLWACSTVCIGKNVACCSKSPQVLPVMRALCRRAPVELWDQNEVDKERLLYPVSSLCVCPPGHEQAYHEQRLLEEEQQADEEE